MEIATYIVRGQLTHKDSMGSAETLGRGAVQYMSAGTGVRHSEFNQSPDKDLRFIQMWLLPKKAGLTPNYGGYAGDLEACTDKFQHVASDVANANAKTPVKVHCDANIFVAEISKGSSVTLPVSEVRQAYVVVLEGSAVSVKAANAVLGAPRSNAEGDAIQVAAAHDAFEVYGGETGTVLSFTAAGATPAHVLVVEMAQDGRGGRTDL
jgi:redox-sensitive bicupin YhaK (pirin superfamily)